MKVDKRVYAIEKQAPHGMYVVSSAHGRKLKERNNAENCDVCETNGFPNCACHKCGRLRIFQDEYV